jgi:hypothetical protein
MISRRGFLVAPAALQVTGSLLAQDTERIYRNELNVIVLNFTVSDARGRYIAGLQPANIRLSEDGIPQKVSIFAESGKPPLSIRDDGTTAPLTEGGAPAGAKPPRLGLKQFESMRTDQENSYTVAYYPASSNQSGTFHKINVDVVHDDARFWRVKHRAGYRK